MPFPFSLFWGPIWTGTDRDCSLEELWSGVASLSLAVSLPLSNMLPQTGTRHNGEHPWLSWPDWRGQLFSFLCSCLLNFLTALDYHFKFYAFYAWSEHTKLKRTSGAPSKIRAEKPCAGEVNSSFFQHPETISCLPPLTGCGRQQRFFNADPPTRITD